MSAISGFLGFIFKNHKLKIIYVLFLAALYTGILFPNPDLSDRISSEITKRTNTYVHFENFALRLFPGFGFGAENIVIEPRFLPSMTAGSIDVSVSLSKLLSLSLGTSTEVKKIFGGELAIELSQPILGTSSSSAIEISLHSQQISLESLTRYLQNANQIGVSLKGVLKADIDRLRIVQTWSEQPSGTLNVEIPAFTFPGQMVTVNMNGVPVPQQIPTLDLGRISLKNAKISEGLIEIPELSIGDSKSELFGKVKGALSLQIRPVAPGVVSPEISNLNFSLKFVADKSFMERHQKTIIGGLLILVPPQCRQETVRGTEISCNMKLARIGEQPIFSPLTEKL